MRFIVVFKMNKSCIISEAKGHVVIDKIFKSNNLNQSK